MSVIEVVCWSISCDFGDCTNVVEFNRGDHGTIMTRRDALREARNTGWTFKGGEWLCSDHKPLSHFRGKL